MVLVPPLYTKERNASCELGRNVEPLAILLAPFWFSLLKVDLSPLTLGQLEDCDLRVISFQRQSSGFTEEMRQAGTALLALLSPFTTLTNYNDDLFPSVRPQGRNCAIICRLCRYINPLEY